jgi:hypothetical protein
MIVRALRTGWSLVASATLKSNMRNASRACTAADIVLYEVTRTNGRVSLLALLTSGLA